jgi:heme b synthase
MHPQSMHPAHHHQHPGGHGSTQGLQVVAWEVTRRCSLSCQHCRGAARDDAYQGELTTQEGKRLIDSIASFAKPILILTGGEPMYRPDIFELARYGTDAGLRVVMSPCGHMITESSSDQIIASGIKRLSISIDGSTAASHDSFRGVAGAFDKAITAFEILRRKGIEFQINTTVSKHNYHELNDIMTLALEQGAVLFNPFFLVPTGRGAAIAHLELSPQEYEEALEWVFAAALKQPIEVRPTCAPHYNRIIRQKASAHDAKPSARMLASRGCLGGQEFVFVSHRGELQPCGFLNVASGTLRDAEFDFRSLYETSPVFTGIRARNDYAGKCGACEFVNVCGGCRARAFEQSGSYLHEEPYCLYQPKRTQRSDAHGHD